METRMSVTPGAQMSAGRPRYESPRVLSLTDLRAGVGQCVGCCTPTGSSAVGYCSNGTHDGHGCDDGSTTEYCSAGSTPGCCVTGGSYVVPPVGGTS
jgi:hypothetical protein